MQFNKTGKDQPPDKDSDYASMSVSCEVNSRTSNNLDSEIVEAGKHYFLSIIVLCFTIIIILSSSSENQFEVDSTLQQKIAPRDDIVVGPLASNSSGISGGMWYW